MGYGMDERVTEERAAEIHAMSDLELLQNAKTNDLASIIESNFRLRTSSDRLARTLVFLTRLLIVLTVPLAIEACFHLYHIFR